MQLGDTTAHSVNGDGVGGDDFPVLRARQDVFFSGPVGDSDPLEGLTIEGVVVSGSEDLPRDVTFTRGVRINGDLVIRASGTVTFNGPVEITGGGDLRIIGADNILFRGGVVLTDTDGSGQYGDLFPEANEITFRGSDESVRGQGVLTLRPTLVGAGIELGTPALSQPTGVLNISNDEIPSAFGDGFSRIVVGHQTASMRRRARARCASAPSTRWTSPRCATRWRSTAARSRSRTIPPATTTSVSKARSPSTRATTSCCATGWRPASPAC
ncbi:hypothetical protein HK414_15850 [Ramlibacter terrae]|uniref:Uncharacterized protein n=1 Tax=Ramlibacter terrae TaxID=2732511 RepID=A0ABX6P4Z9_9BURK|nr:hypothetical protein HK414_15850 [Ramlibacter terrae]